MKITGKKTKVYTINASAKEMEALRFIARAAKGAPLSAFQEEVRMTLASQDLK